MVHNPEMAHQSAEWDRQRRTGVIPVRCIDCGHEGHANGTLDHLGYDKVDGNDCDECGSRRVVKSEDYVCTKTEVGLS